MKRGNKKEQIKNANIDSQRMNEEMDTYWKKAIENKEQAVVSAESKQRQA